MPCGTAPHQHLDFPGLASEQDQRGGVARSHKAFLNCGKTESAGFRVLPTGASIAAAAPGGDAGHGEGVRRGAGIDFTQVIAGPFCTQHLAMMGADVIKLEQRTGGDQGRYLIGDNDLGRAGMSPMFLSINSGKRALTLDLKHPRAREVVHRLVAGANIVVENFKAGTMDRLGFGYEALKEVRPGLVFCSISGYGQTGPYAGAPAYDGAIQAASGMMSVTGHPDTGPVRAGFTAVDLSTGITAAFACASALYRQKATGEGQRLDVTMFESSLSMLAPAAHRLSDHGQHGGPGGQFLAGARAHGGLLPRQGRLDPDDLPHRTPMAGPLPRARTAGRRRRPALRR